MKVDISKLRENVLGENVETLDMFQHLVAESNACRALSFFNIKYDEETHSMTTPDDLNYDEAINIVSAYLEYVEDEEMPKDISADVRLEAMRYDAYTRPFRGADDGTFDYAGTYMIEILETLQRIADQQNVVESHTIYK